MSETMFDSRTDTTSTPAASAATTARRRQRGIVTASAAAAAFAVWAVAAVASDAPLRAIQQGDPRVIGAGEVLAIGVLAALAGWALLAILERFTARSRTIWTGVAVVALIASLGGPLSAGVGAGSKTALALMHLVVGALVIVGLRRTAR